MTAAPGYRWVRFSSKVRPIDIAPYLFDDKEQEPVMVRVRVQHRARIQVSNESNPRYLAFQTHLANEAERREIADKAMLTLWKYRNNRPITQVDYDNLYLAHQTLFNNDFEHMIPAIVVARVADKLLLEQEVMQ